MKRDVPAFGAVAATRTETAVPTPRQVIPDGCNLGVLLRVLVGVHGALLLATIAFDGFRAVAWSQFVSAAGFVAPITLLTLILWCLARRLLPPLRPEVQRVIAWAIPVALTALVVEMLRLADYRTETPALLAHLAIALAAGAAVQHYLELRARAFSPAMAEARFQALQSRIRPHFFFNSLNAVLSVIRTDPPRAERMLESIAELFRAVMGDVRKLVPFEQELDLCRRYVEIEQTRLGDRLVVDWQIGAVHPRAKIPQLLLQPIIENAVRYGAERVEGKCEVRVKVRQLGFSLEICVANPIAREPLQREGNQIGLNNIRGRLALIYDLEARLETKARGGTFELTMTLPVEHKA